MPLTRRRFAQAMASALLFRHLPGIAQTPLTFAIGRPPEGNIIRRVVSAGAPADVLLLAVAPEKLVGFSFLISRARRRFPSPSPFGRCPNWAGWRGAPARCLWKGCWPCIPIW